MIKAPKDTKHVLDVCASIKAVIRSVLKNNRLDSFVIIENMLPNNDLGVSQQEATVSTKEILFLSVASKQDYCQ